MPLSNWIWHKILKTNNAKRGLFSFIAFVLFIVLLVVVYTLILQRNFSGEILESGIARNQLRAESVFDLKESVIFIPQQKMKRANSFMSSMA